MASNNDIEYAISRLTLENEVKVPIEIIEKSDFKFLDQIINFKEFIFIIDWGKEPCIHVLDVNFRYIKKLTSYDNNNKYQYFKSMAIIKIFDSEYLGVLTNQEIRFISVKENEIEIDWLERSIFFDDQNIENHHIFSDLKLKMMPNKTLRLYGLIQDNSGNDETIYFIETNSIPKRYIITYLNNKFSIRSLTLPDSFNLPCLKDLKIKGQHLFFNDYQIRPKNKNIYMGNNCIHIFNKEIEYITSFGFNDLNGPYSLNFIEDELFVCERKQNGCIKVFKNEPNSDNYRLINRFDLKCKYPYFFFKLDNHFFVTQAYGNQFDYEGSAKIFKFYF